MGSDTTIEALGRLLELHTASLPLYLNDASPWKGPGSERAVEAIRLIAEDQRRMADRFAQALMELGAPAVEGEYPLLFTGFNDLSSEYLVREMIRRQEAELAQIEACVAELRLAPAQQELAKEASGAALAHLDRLRELTSAPALAVH